MYFQIQTTLQKRVELLQMCSVFAWFSSVIIRVIGKVKKNITLGRRIVLYYGCFCAYENLELRIIS